MNPLTDSQKQARIQLSILLYGPPADLSSVPEAYPYQAPVVDMPRVDKQADQAVAG